MFSCPLCAKSLTTDRGLKVHLVSHTKEKPHRCLTCSAAFGILSQLKGHMRSVHDGIKEIKQKNSRCSLCDYRCHSKTELSRHLLKHSAEQPISCSIPGCDFKTKHEKCLQKHVSGVHNQERPYECPAEGCNYKAKSRGNLSSHLKIHRNDKPFACTFPGCNYTCKKKDYLTAHTIRAHTEEEQWKCSLCAFRTKHRSNLKHHEDTHGNVKRFKCQVPNCGYASHQKRLVGLHFDSKHRKKDVSCTAQGCSYKCSSQAKLKGHLQEHDLPILKCPLETCNFSTRDHWALLKHNSSRHGDMPFNSIVVPRNPDQIPDGTVERLYCHVPNCNYQTEFPHRIDRHMKTHGVEENQKHVCKLCSTKFSTLSNLRMHLQRHTQEKPYSCSHCVYASMDEHSLRRHARLVHRIHLINLGRQTPSERKCRTCNVNFSSYSELTLHSMSHLKPVVVLERLRLHIV